MKLIVSFVGLGMRSMQFLSVYILYDTVNRDVITKVDCTYTCI